jgi:NAD(P)-dependent dehydrogenase (short-subunit alcohol dehydrogenase family)
MTTVLSRRYKPSNEAVQRHRADVALAGRRAELLETAHEAESRFREAGDRLAPDAELHRLAVELDTALTEAMRAAYAAQRAEIGPRGYEDRIFRRKAMAKPRVHALTAEAERLLTLRETHRLNDIPDVPFEPSPEASPYTRG